MHDILFAVADFDYFADMDRILRSFRLKKSKHEESDSKRSMREPRITGDPHSQPSDTRLPSRHSITPEHHSGPAHFSSESSSRQNQPIENSSPTDLQPLFPSPNQSKLQRSASAKRRRSQDNEQANNSGSKDDSTLSNRNHPISEDLPTKPRPQVPPASNSNRMQSAETFSQHIVEHQSTRAEDPSSTPVGAQSKPFHKFLPLDLGSKLAFNHHSHHQSSHSQSQRQSAPKTQVVSDRRKHSIPGSSGAAVVASHEFECFLPPAMPSDMSSRVGPNGGGAGEPSRFAPGRRSARATTTSTQGTSTSDLGATQTVRSTSHAALHSAHLLPTLIEIPFYASLTPRSTGELLLFSVRVVVDK